MIRTPLKAVAIVLLLTVLFIAPLPTLYAQEPDAEPYEPGEQYAEEWSPDALSETDFQALIDEGIPTEEIVKGVVVYASEPIVEVQEYVGFSIHSEYQNVRIKMLEGEYKNREFKSQYTLSLNTENSFKANVLKEGYRVYVIIEKNSSGELTNIFVGDIIRTNSLLLLMGLFAVVLLAIGGRGGFKTLISLCVTIVLVFAVALPLIYRGANPLLMATGIAILSTGITLTIIGGRSKKTLAASIGTIGGVMVSAIIAILFTHLSRLTGYSEEALMLSYLPSGVHFDFKGLLYAGVIITSLGACMDVGMSISSPMHEILDNSPDISRGKLLRMGMNIGRDTMGTMANTLILALVGASLQMIMLMMALELPVMQLLNREMIATEIIIALSGSLGLGFTIPITVMMTYLLNRRKAGPPEAQPIPEEHLHD